MSAPRNKKEDGDDMNHGAGMQGKKNLFQHTEMPDHVFMKLSKVVYNESGIKLNENKKLMLASRLRKRLVALGIRTYSEYYDYLCNPESTHEELCKMIDVVSTNKTEFFREGDHFSFLANKALPAIVKSAGFRGKGIINIWSAGCSSGEEPYTIAMVCSEFFGNGSGEFRILATDISTRVLETAKKAIYQDSIIEGIPAALRYKYFMHGKGDKAGYHRVVPELREKVTVKRLNLVNDNFRAIPKMDIIFCRNVVIYFDRETQFKLYQKLLDHLNPDSGGYLFIGHSEALHSNNKSVRCVAPTIYYKAG